MRVFKVLIILLFWNSCVWAETFSLSQCIQIALSQYPGLKAAQQMVIAAQKYEKASLKEYLPQLGISYSFTQLKDPQQISFLGMDIPISSDQIAQGDLWLNFPLFHGFSLRVNHCLAKLQVKLAQVEEERSRQELVLHVKEAYYRLLQAQRRKQEALKSVERLKAHLKEAQGFYEQGLIAKNDLLQSEVALAQAEHALVVAENLVKMAQSSLNILMQRPVDASISIIDNLKEAEELPDFKSCLKKAFKRRPELKAAYLALKKSQQEIKLAQSSFYPWVDLQAVYHREGDSWNLQENPYGTLENFWVGFSLHWKLWEWGKSLDQVSSARAKTLAMEANLKVLQEKIALEVRRAYLNLKAAKDRIYVSKRAIKMAQENFRLSQARYQQQLASSSEVLDAEDMLTKAQVNLVNALADYQLARAYLDYTMGTDETARFLRRSIK